MSARQLSRLARAKGLDPLLGGVVNVESEESGGSDDSEEEDERFLQDTRRAGVVSASVSPHTRMMLTAVALLAVALSMRWGCGDHGL